MKSFKEYPPRLRNLLASTQNNYLAQCNTCKDIFTIFHDSRAGWEPQSSFAVNEKNMLYHKCGGLLKLWQMNS